MISYIRRWRSYQESYQLLYFGDFSLTKYSIKISQYNFACFLPTSDILISVLSSLVHLVGIFLYNLPHPRAGVIVTYGVRLATRVCVLIYLTVAFRDKIRLRTVKGDYKTLHLQRWSFLFLFYCVYVADFLFSICFDLCYFLFSSSKKLI